MSGDEPSSHAYDLYMMSALISRQESRHRPDEVDGYAQRLSRPPFAPYLNVSHAMWWLPGPLTSWGDAATKETRGFKSCVYHIDGQLTGRCACQITSWYPLVESYEGI